MCAVQCVYVCVMVCEWSLLLPTIAIQLVCCMFCTCKGVCVCLCVCVCELSLIATHLNTAIQFVSVLGAFVCVQLVHLFLYMCPCVCAYSSLIAT